MRLLIFAGRMVMDMLRQVKTYMLRERMLERRQVVVAAVSGGVDSMVMAHLLDRLQGELCFQLVIANFNHRLRPEAEAEAEFVGDWARRRGLPFCAGAADIARLAKGKNVQDIARRERYAFLRSAAFRLGDAVISTAHHRDDQAETVLLHLLRGSGTAGIAAMRPAENNVVRPLLCVSRADILAYARENSVEWREDASNASGKYLRNRIRHTLLPQLAAYNPRIGEALNNAALICRDEDALLDEMAEISFAELWMEDAAALDGPGFDALAPALRRRVLRKAFCLAVGERPELSFSQVEAVLALRDGQACTLPRGMQAYRRGHVYFAREIPPLPVHDETFPLCVNAAGNDTWHMLHGLGWAYQAMAAETPPAVGLRQFALSPALAEQARWRTRRPGDSLPSQGKRGRRKLKELFIDAHVPQHQRGCWPLLATDTDILWVPGLWQAENCANGRNCVLIKIRRCDKI